MADLARPSPLQNRVDPFGQIKAVTQRGTFTGNRGIIHEGKSLLKRRWTTKAWIICRCSFKQRRRIVMSPGTWTELFFLDEATALAAGHRPCFFCRRQAAKTYTECYADAFGIAAPKVGEIDAVLHKQRLASGGSAQPLHANDVAALPDGTMIAVDDKAALISGGAVLPWSFSGYAEPLPRTALDRRALAMITPEATVAVLRAGYRPQIGVG